MRVLRVLLALTVVGAGNSAAFAADLSGVQARSRVVTVSREAILPQAVAARPATLGIGYSAVRLTRGRPGGAYYVHVVCPVGRGAFAQSYCPTPEHEAYCPSALIVCR